MPSTQNNAGIVSDDFQNDGVPEDEGGDDLSDISADNQTLVQRFRGQSKLAIRLEIVACVVSIVGLLVGMYEVFIKKNDNPTPSPYPILSPITPSPATSNPITPSPATSNPITTFGNAPSPYPTSKSIEPELRHSNWTPKELEPGTTITRSEKICETGAYVTSLKFHNVNYLGPTGIIMGCSDGKDIVMGDITSTKPESNLPAGYSRDEFYCSNGFDEIRFYYRKAPGKMRYVNPGRYGLGSAEISCVGDFNHQRGSYTTYENPSLEVDDYFAICPDPSKDVVVGVQFQEIVDTTNGGIIRFRFVCEIETTV